MKNDVLLAVLFLSGIGCSKKSIPVITERNADLPAKVSYTYPPVSALPADTLAGRQLFTSRCGRCHALPEPQQFTVSRWESILPIMFPRTRLSTDQAFQVRAYLLANAASK